MAQPDSRTTNPPPERLSPWRDTVIVILATLAAAYLASRFELSEALFASTRNYEFLQLDEWPTAIFVLALGLMWLSWRRYRQAELQLQARRSAEARLAEALALNRELTYEHLKAQESERKHLARELHDELGQYLNAIKIDAVALREPADGGFAGAASGRIVKAVDHVHGVVSDLINRLRPAGLDELGLLAALENCIGHWRQRVPDRNFSFQSSGTFEGLPELTCLTLYRLVQEGLTNSHKHGQAAAVDIVLQRTAAEPGELILKVRDDGKGMTSAPNSRGFGLRGMRERVAMMGGGFTIEAAPGAGFGFEARLPAFAPE
jgi:signal transduction histidine kinase